MQDLKQNILNTSEYMLVVAGDPILLVESYWVPMALYSNTLLLLPTPPHPQQKNLAGIFQGAKTPGWPRSAYLTVGRYHIGTSESALSPSHLTRHSLCVRSWNVMGHTLKPKQPASLTPLDTKTGSRRAIATADSTQQCRLQVTPFKCTCYSEK